MDAQSRLEWLKFGALAAVLLGTILVIWAAAPAIFDRVVPAVLGEPDPEPSSIFLPSTTSEEERNLPDPTVEPEPTVPIEIIADQPAETATPAEESTVSDSPTIVPRTHVIAAGETLIDIAANYGISLDTLLKVNQIPNPNRIQAGDEIIIPAAP